MSDNDDARQAAFEQAREALHAQDPELMELLEFISEFVDGEDEEDDDPAI